MKSIKHFTCFFFLLAFFYCCNSCAPCFMEYKDTFDNPKNCESFIEPQKTFLENPSSRTIVFEDSFIDGQFSPDGTLFATGGNNGLNIYSFVSEEPILIQTKKFLGDIEFVRWSPDGKLIALSSTDKFLYLYDINKQEIINWRSVGSYRTPYMEWSSDGRFIFTLTGSPFFDAENVIGRLYETEGLRFVKEYYYPETPFGYQTPLTFDWNRDNPEEAQLLVRTGYDFFYFDGENLKSTYLEISDISPNFDMEVFWLGQKNFLALNYYSKEEATIFVSDGKVVSKLSVPISSDANNQGNIYNSTLNRSKDLIISFGGTGILFHCIGEKELVYLGAIQYSEFHISDRLIVNWERKDAYVHKWHSNELIHFNLSDILK